MEAPAPLAAPARGERKRKRKKRSKPYNPRRHFEEDDYVSGRRLLRVRRAGLPLRNSEIVERGADRGRVRVQEGREERLSRLRPAESCSGSFFLSRQIRHSTLPRKPATIAGRWATPACGVHVRSASLDTIMGGVAQTSPSVRGAGRPIGPFLRAGTAGTDHGCPDRNARATRRRRYLHRGGVPSRTLSRRPKRRWCEPDGLATDPVPQCPRGGKRLRCLGQPRLWPPLRWPLHIGPAERREPARGGDKRGG